MATIAMIAVVLRKAADVQRSKRLTVKTIDSILQDMASELPGDWDMALNDARIALMREGW